MAITIPILTDFNGSGIDRGIKQFSQLEGAGAKAGFAIKKAALPAAAALGALGAGAIVAAKAAAEDAAAQDKLAGVLRRVTGANDDAVIATESFITSMSQQLGVADDELRPALGKLATATGDVKKAQDLLKIALDTSAATGKPLESVTTGLAKAYGGNLGALNKLIPGFDKGIIKSKDFAAAQDELARLTGGAAADNANTAAGQFKRLQITLDETKESVGAALLPVFEAFLPILQSIGKFAQENSKLIVILAGVFGGLAAAVIAVNMAMKVFGAIALLTNPIGLVIAAVAALVAGIILLWKRSETFRDVVTAVWEKVQDAVAKVVDFFDGPVKAAFDVISGVIGALVALVKGDFSAVWDNLKQAAGGVIDWLKETLLKLPLIVLGLVLDVGKAIVTGIANGATGLADKVWESIKGMPGALLALAAGWVSKLGEIGGGVIQWIKNGVTGLAEAIWDKISGFADALWNKVKGVAGDVKDIGSSIIGWIGDGLEAGATALGNIVKAAINVVIGALNTGIAGINKGISLLNKVNPFDDVPEIPKIPKLARGGIVTRPTLALVGEAGPEAVVPLNRANGMGMTINIEAGLISTPDQIGQQIIEAIQRAQRRSGPVFAPA
jgi:hypothetical protein